MKLVNVVLTKMPNQVRLSNPYAIKLDQRLVPVMVEIGSMPQSVMNDISTISDNVELMGYLDEKVNNMISLLLTVC